MLPFVPEEFDARALRLRAAMSERGLDAMLLFAPESQYWLTGYDTFGYCFFQCLVVTQNHMALLTRSADLRQAQITSTLKDIRVWKDAAGADPSADLAALLADLGVAGAIGWETDTQGLTGLSAGRVSTRLPGLIEASDLIPPLRLVKSEAEIDCIRRAADLTDASYEAALEVVGPGADEAEILAVLQGEILRRGGGYAGNQFIIGSGETALLCRYQAQRRNLDADDQLTLEWSGAWNHYHAAAMRTVVIGRPRPKHERMHAAAAEALAVCEAALKPGRPMADVFDAHARVLDAHGLSSHRLNACGYAMGASFPPCWMDPHMFYDGAPTVMAENMVFFLHMILMDSESGAAMTLGRSSLIRAGGAEPLSRLGLEMPRR